MSHASITEDTTTQFTASNRIISYLHTYHTIEIIVHSIDKCNNPIAQCRCCSMRHDIVVTAITIELFMHSFIILISSSSSSSSSKRLVETEGQSVLLPALETKQVYITLKKLLIITCNHNTIVSFSLRLTVMFITSLSIYCVIGFKNENQLGF